MSTLYFIIAIAICSTLVVVGLILKSDLTWGLGLMSSIPVCAIYCVDHKIPDPSKT